MKLSPQNLRLVLIGVAGLLSLAIIYFAFVDSLGDGESVATADTADAAASPVVVAVANPTPSWLTADPGTVQAATADDGISTACRLPTADAPVMVVAHNDGQSIDDYRVEVELSDADETAVRALATFDALRPGETRFKVPVWSAPLGPVTSCRVLIVETDRQVLIRNDS